MKPLINIVTPVYNAAALVPMTIRSVLEQTFKDWELSIVDDGSTDESAAAIRPFLSDKRVQYIWQENQERSVARNRGIAVSASRYVAFLDADDMWHPQKLAEQIELMNGNAEIGMCYTYAGILSPNGRSETTYAQPMAKDGWVFDDLLRGNFITISSVLVRREVLEQAGLFDTNRALLGSEDWDLWLRITRKHPVGVLRKYRTTYRAHSGIQSHLKIFQGALAVLNKNFSDREFAESSKIPKHRACSYAYLSAAGFSAATIGRAERMRLLLGAIRLDWSALFTAPAVPALARVALPSRLVSWLQQSRTSS